MQKPSEIPLDLTLYMWVNTQMDHSHSHSQVTVTIEYLPGLGLAATNLPELDGLAGLELRVLLVLLGMNIIGGFIIGRTGVCRLELVSGPRALNGLLRGLAMSRSNVGVGRNGGMTGFRVSLVRLELGGFISCRINFSTCKSCPVRQDW